MKMRRSLWRKLLVLLFAILTAVSTYFTVQNYIPATATSGLELAGAVKVSTTETGDPDFPYLCTIEATVNNISTATQKPVLFEIVVSDGSTKETRQVPFTASSIKAGKSAEVTETFPTKRAYKTATSVSVTMSRLKASYVLYGATTTRKLPQYVKAMIAISVILFGVFVYTVVALLLSPKKRVHSRHHHHHHHHHHSSEQSDSE